MFADKVEIGVRGGHGGDGRMSFRHEKYRAMGGPDGGDGGRGGNVVLVADHNLNTLSAYRTQRLVKAEAGEAGKGNRSHGKAGKDVVLNVPEGTMVYDGDELIVDLTVDGQEFIIASGGRGGFGNAHFVSSTRQAPRAAELGEPGEQRHLVLELKLVADIGLVGLPNAGKSTLLSVISNAKPEIADYPFTTLVPNLGVVDIDDTSVLVADIPGLIEGASQGKGLGDEFLRHVERTAVLLHLIDSTSDNVVTEYKTIQKELGSYVVDLSSKPQIVVLSKSDAVDDKAIAAKQRELKLAGAGLVTTISASAHRGLSELLRLALPLVTKAREEHASRRVTEAIHVIDETSQPDLWLVEPEGSGWRVRGEKVEGFARRTDWNNDASVERLRDILRKIGIARELERQGAEAGSTVVIAGHEFEWL